MMDELIDQALRWLEDEAYEGAVNDDQDHAAAAKTTAAVITKLQRELQSLREENKRLRDIVSHCWVHSGYKDCGYKQMTTSQKELYDDVISENVDVSP